jgi:hypothetical protein
LRIEYNEETFGDFTIRFSKIVLSIAGKIEDILQEIITIVIVITATIIIGADDKRKRLPRKHEMKESTKKLIKPLMNTNKHEKLILELVSISVNSWLKFPFVSFVVS